MKITVLIPVFNAEKTLRKTLESVRWADEILIVDSFSTDSTLALCREYAVRILQHEYYDSASQKNWAIPQCTHPWVLQVDSDEVLEEGLKEEILNAVEKSGNEIQAFKIPRKNYAYGRWLRYGGFYPDYQMRLFRREQGRFQDRRVHAHIKVPGRTGILRGSILHYDFKDLSSWLIKFERYMRYECDELVKSGKRFRLRYVTIYPAAVFLRDYFWRQGFRDGFPGFLMAVLNSLYCFTRYCKLKEAQFGTTQKSE